MIKIIYKGKDLIKIKRDTLKAFDFVSKSFLHKNPINIIVRVHSTRLEFDKQLGKKTEDWLVANASNIKKEVDILSPLALEKESSHDKSEFLQILKHEFTHLIANDIAKNKTIPMWLNEGLAEYIAGQYKQTKEHIFIEENFCKKLGTLKGWDKNVNYGAYNISALFINFLIKKYSFKKIGELLISLDKNYYYPSFKEIFSRVYKQDLCEAEKMFVIELNKNK